MKRWVGEAAVTANRSPAPRFHELRFRVPAALDPAGGQFVMIRARRPGRDPLLSRAYSVYDRVSGGDGTTQLAILFRVHGKGTACLSTLAAGDRVWRKLFAGKVQPIAQQPETVLYSYLTAPRDAVPRWYAEGIAVFVETWMAGGSGGPRAPGTRWSSDRWCATAATSTTRSAWSPRGPRSIFRSR